jgi:hypothetical protein
LPGKDAICNLRPQSNRKLEQGTGHAEKEKQMMANFSKPVRWAALAVILIAAAAMVAWTGVLSKKVDLTGTVFTRGDQGQRVPVAATVFIATAAPKTGTSTFCPSCYADCSKHARTDAKGGFKIKKLDPQLTFQILVAAKGYKPKYVAKVDPAKGKLVKVELEPSDSAAAAPESSMRGRVVNAKGRPIEGAVVEMQGLETKDGGGRWGGLSGVDPLAVTDENGEFLITAKEPFDMMTVKVTAPKYADKNFNRLASGETPHELAMSEGATLTGRVLLEGKPLADVSVGVSAVERRAGSYLGHFEAGTDGRGKFVFLNLPPDADFQIYSVMSTMKKFGAVPPRQIHTGKDGETTDAGDLVAGPAHRLAGRVVLSDDQPVPPKTRLTISRENAWDSMQVTLDEEGNFNETGVPSEIISLSVRTRGYHVSARNLSVDQMNPFRLIGRVDQDITNLEFVLEKGPEPRPDYNHMDPEYNETRNRPLSGAEGVRDHSRDWMVAGRVLDSETKEPLQNFRVTPGQAGQFNRTDWSSLRAVDGVNGVYETYISKRVAEPLLKVEADGYLPESATLLPQDATNVDFAMKRGSGPAGTVVGPNGKPAVGASVVLLNDDYNQASFNGKGELTVYQNQSGLHTTDGFGKFAFKPAWGMTKLAAASAEGFASVSLESFANHPIIKLEAFGSITGTLKRTSGPGTNESLDVSFADADAPRINMWLPANTDAEGHFTFERVPAGHLRISSRRMMGGMGHGWSSEPLEEVDVKPGQALEVNITAPDRTATEAVNTYKPPPPPKLIAGVEVKGTVLLPGGGPAAGADVALQIEGRYLAVGKGAFIANSLREEGLLVSAGPDGRFKLPMYEGAKSVVALNEEGYAQVSLAQLKASPQITLQKWGRIEGVLSFGHHPGTNQQIVLSPAQGTLQPPNYDFNAFQARTDGQGRFVITFVPPGEQTLARLVSTGDRSSMHSQVGAVMVKPGETTVTNVGGAGRTVTGTIKPGDVAASEIKHGFVTINTPISKIMRQVSALKTDEERKKFYQSEEYRAAMKVLRNFSTALLPDGSFRAEDVLPGNYEVNFHHRMPAEHGDTLTTFTSLQELAVPEAKDKDDDSIVDWGEIKLEKHTMPMPN